ncbi:MAG: methyl-accepting chemotaxis protein [Mariprofundus sp.]|nr:methyl-accepting chemotaxis protein [Mariprofundus sp.]
MKTFLGNISFSKKMALIGVLFALGLCGIVAYTVMTLEVQEVDAVVIDVATDSPMLIQGLSNELEDEYHNKLADHAGSEKAAALFEMSLMALEKGGQTLTGPNMDIPTQIAANEVPAVATALDSVVMLWGEQKIRIAQLHDAMTAAANQSLQMKNILATNHLIMEDMHHIADQLSGISTAKVAHMQNVELMVLAGVLLMGGFLLFTITRAVTQPLQRAVSVAENIAKGHLDNNVLNSQRDEVGKLLSAMGMMQTNLNGLLNEEIVPMLEAGMQGDLDHTLDETGKEGFFLQLTHVTNAFTDQVHLAIVDTVAALSALKYGDLSQRITNEYQGSFDMIKQASNGIAEQLDLVVNKQIAPVWQGIQQGDMSGRVALEGKQGFYLQLASATNTLSEQLSSVMSDTIGGLTALEQGQLGHRISAVYEGDFNRIKQANNNTAQQLGEVIGNMAMAADEVGVGSGEIAQGNNTLSDRTQAQAAALEQTAASIEEITGSVQQTEENTRVANQLSLDAKSQASLGGEIAHRAVEAMVAIDDSSRKISDIIGVIDEIAFQTNLLALNAAVEAARAGDQGLGFAVVASEVRNLAQRSGTAAKEIKGLINESAKDVSLGRELVEQSGKTLTQIVDAVGKVNDVMLEISAASAEQSSGINQINQAIAQLDAGTQQNTAMVEESAAASERLSGQAEKLRQQVNMFELAEPVVDQYDSFIPAHVRAKMKAKQQVQQLTDGLAMGSIIRSSDSEMDYVG